MPLQRLLFIAMLAVSLGACTSPAPVREASTPAPAMTAQSASATTATAAPTDTNAVDPQAVQALKDMGTYLQSLTRFNVQIALDGERVLADGQKLQHSARATIDAERPNHMRIQMISARNQRNLVYDGKTVTLSEPQGKYYASAPFTGNLAELISHLRDRFAIEVPMEDLFLWGTPNAPTQGIVSAMSAGGDYIDRELCNHYAFRQGSLDWQIWISTGDKPLPRKIVITNRADDARPQSTTWLRWNTNPNFNQAIFRYVPPKGAQSAELTPVKSR